MTKTDFESLPILDQRVLVAKDVLKNVKEKKYVPVTTGYLRFEAEALAGLHGKELQQEIKTVQSCEACALGCAFVSLINFVDNYKIDKNNFFAEHSLKSEDIYDEKDRYIPYSQRPLIAYKLDPQADETFKPSMRKLWGDQIDIIEAAFMQGYDDCLRFDEDQLIHSSDDDDEVVYTEDLKRAITFGNQFDEPDDRLAAIMQNIIDNHGVFKP